MCDFESYNELQCIVTLRTAFYAHMKFEQKIGLRKIRHTPRRYKKHIRAN